MVDMDDIWVDWDSAVLVFGDESTEWTELMQSDTSDLWD